jgi:predicted phosphate transport protein (TIGR00153 family)
MTVRDEFRQRVDQAVLVLFASVIESLGWATAALLDGDMERADRVIADDRQVDVRCNELTGLIMSRLSHATVEPNELEDLIALLQMVPELERSADLAEHIAQRTRQGLGGSITPRSRGLIQSMCDVGVRMWQLTSRAYAERSGDVRFQLAEADDELDELSARLLSSGAGGGADPAVAAELALVARFYERLGDHAVNLSRRIDSMAAPHRLSPRLQLTGARGPAPARGPRRRVDAAAYMEWLERAWAVLARTPPRQKVPTGGGFFELFQAAAANGRDCAEELRKMVTSLADLDDHYQEIRRLERRGDQITQDLLRRLDASQATPYGREDIHALTEELDDVVDDMFAAAELIHLVRVEQALPEVTELADVLAVMAGEMDALIGCLQNREGARYRLERIQALEHEGDAVYRRSIGHLFSGEYEALEVLKWKDIVQALENAVNRIEDVSDVVESILVKNP